MPIEKSENGPMIITGHGDLPEGGISFYALLTARQAMKMHVETNGQLKLTRMATVSNVRRCVNENYPHRPDGPFTGRTAKNLLVEIENELVRQGQLNEADRAVKRGDF